MPEQYQYEVVSFSLFFDFQFNYCKSAMTTLQLFKAPRTSKLTWYQLSPIQSSLSFDVQKIKQNWIIEGWFGATLNFILKSWLSVFNSLYMLFLWTNCSQGLLKSSILHSGGWFTHVTDVSLKLLLEASFGLSYWCFETHMTWSRFWNSMKLHGINFVNNGSFNQCILGSFIIHFWENWNACPFMDNVW